MIYYEQIQVPDIPAYTNRKFLLRRKVYKLACTLDPLDPEIWIDFRNFLQTTLFKNYNPGWDYLVSFSGEAEINKWGRLRRPALFIDLYEVDENFYVGGASFVHDLLHNWWAKATCQENPPKADIIIWQPGQPDLVLQGAVLRSKKGRASRDLYLDVVRVDTCCWFVGEKIYRIGGKT